MPKISLKNRALNLLARREHSRGELRAKLLIEDEPATIDQLLDELEAKNWQSDERFAEAWIRQRSLKYGRQRLRHELQQKGVSAELIAASLDRYLEDELTQARSVWQKKYGIKATTYEEKSKQIRFLQYRGYGWDIIRQLIDHDDDTL